MRDMQKNRVYRWESPFYADNPHMSIREAQELVNQISEDFRIDPPKVVYGNKKGKSTYTISTNIIEISLLMQNKGTVIHETIHAIIHDRFDKLETRVASHGPEFVRVLMVVLERYTDMKWYDLLFAAKKNKVKIAERNTIREFVFSNTKNKYVMV